MSLAQTRSRTRLAALLTVALLIGATIARLSLGAAAQDQTASDLGVTTIVGTVNLDLASNLYGYLVVDDLSSFIHRDYSIVQSPHTIMGWVDHDTGDYEVDLPIVPHGTVNDVGHGKGGAGVQVYSVDSYYDAVHDPRPGSWESGGWAWSDSSITTRQGDHEVTGGRVLVWAPDAAQLVPTDFGADGKLFTDDDPVGPVPAGWTVLDLDEHPFAQIRTGEVEIQLGRGDLGPVDLSQLPVTEAFDKMVDYLKLRYPMADAKPIDWEALRAKFRPEFETAEQSGEQVDLYIAIHDFVLDLGIANYFSNLPWADYYLPMFLGSTGLHVDATDDGKLIVVKVDSGQAAEQAGIETGAEIVTWDGLPAMQAVEARPQIFLSSTPQNTLGAKLELFGRVPSGTTVDLTYRNPGTDAPVAGTLTGTEIPGEDLGRSVSCFRATSECHYQTPLTVDVLPSNIAVIRIRYFGSDAEDVRLIAEAWDRAITNLSFSDVKGVILDVRGAGPEIWYSLPSYIAGSFFKEEFPLLWMTSVDEQGQITDEGTMMVRPNPAQWDRPVAVLVDENCWGNCEIFVTAMMHKPDVIVAGFTATAGAVATPYQAVLLPNDGLVMPVEHVLRDPVTRQVVIEGTGIEPTLRVPKTVDSVVAAVTSDPVKDAAEQALLAQIAAAEAAPATPPAS